MTLDILTPDLGPDAPDCDHTVILPTTRPVAPGRVFAARYTRSRFFYFGRHRTGVFGALIRLVLA